MLWFNAEKDLGALRTEDDERIEVPGSAFAAGEKPVARCAGKAVVFERVGGGDDVRGITFLPELSPRRARMRHRR